MAFSFKYILLIICSVQVCKLIAAVSSLETTSTVNLQDTDTEVQTCQLTDLTGTIQLSLWEPHIDSLALRQTYVFNNLSTRLFNSKTTLTTTSCTSITQHSTEIPLPTTTDANKCQPKTHTLTQPLEGATININKQCPKCHTTQKNFNTADSFHKCQTCKITRRNTSYITKYNGYLVFLVEKNELTLAITNSVFSKFLKTKQDCTSLDSQDIEQFLLKLGPVEVEYTHDNQITHMSTPSCRPQQHTSNETHAIDELCAIPDDILCTELPSFTETMPCQKRHAAKEHTKAKQPRPPKESH